MRPFALALLATLTLATAGMGQDACLTGASVLADQRDLAALRDATETACPCASFTKRGLYLKCARDALRTALEAGDLRQECRRTAMAVNNGSVCGSGKVACGYFKETAKAPVSCRPRPPSRCQDGPLGDAAECTAETHCADVVDWTAGTCTDVRDFGPFAPGVRVITFSKQSEYTYCQGGTGNCTATPYGPGCACGSAASCQSGVCTQQTRNLQTSIWYPAPPGSGPIDGGTGGVLNAPLDASGGPYPLLMFSHGSCGYANQSKFLTPLVASYGFVVAAPPHPGNTLNDFPACGTGQAQIASAIERPQDIIHVTDEMLAADLDPGSPFYTAIDEARIGMSGHSFGGFTTYLVIPLDPRFIVAMPLAAAVPGSPMLDVPSLTMLGQVDSVVNNTNIRNAYTNALPPKYLVEIKNAGHFAFSDLCFPGPDCNPPVTLTQDESHDAVLRYAVPFLRVHLAGDESFRPFLVAPPGPGVVYQQEP